MKNNAASMIVLEGENCLITQIYLMLLPCTSGNDNSTVIFNLTTTTEENHSAPPTGKPYAGFPSDKPTPALTLYHSSSSPSRKPSAHPSDRPSSSPSMSPTNRPTKSPTKEPSDIPSQGPIDVPSLAPSAMPSLKPSQFPSDVPSLDTKWYNVIIGTKLVSICGTK